VIRGGEARVGTKSLSLWTLDFGQFLGTWRVNIISPFFGRIQQKFDLTIKLDECKELANKVFFFQLFLNHFD